MSTADPTALLWLVAVLPIAIWICWTDMASMKIPNKAVIALMGVFGVLGLIVLPFDDYLWRWAQFGVVLAIGFVLSSVRAVGAGDAKFAAAMAPFIAPGDLTAFLILFSVVLLAAFATHRTAKAIPGLRARFPEWESWNRREFPMGLALGPALVFYFAMSFLAGASGAA